MSNEAATEVVVPHAAGGMAGSIGVPPSKSLTQRALVAAALAGGGSRVRRPLDAADPRLLFEGLRRAGFRLTWEAGEVRADGWSEAPTGSLSMGNNGTGVRFLLAQLAATRGVWTVDGVPRLRERPLAPLVEALRELGASIRPSISAGASELRLPLEVVGAALRGGEVQLDSSASSQFASALLLLGPRLPGGLVVHLTSSPPSQPYVELTRTVLEAFGVASGVEERGTVLVTSGGGYRPASFTVEGDWSAAAFPFAAVAAAGGEVEARGVRLGSRQGDARVLQLLGDAGCRARATTGGVAMSGPATRPLRADLRDAPDLFPPLAVVVAVAGGELSGLAGLAAKESPRLEVMRGHLEALGFAVEGDDDRLASAGSPPRGPAPGQPLSPAGDHRIAMALAVAGALVPGVRVSDPASVGKSWPSFWEDWAGLFGKPQ